jgi:hypothetical protein
MTSQQLELIARRSLTLPEPKEDGSALSWLYPVKNFMLHAILLAKRPIVRLDMYGGALLQQARHGRTVEQRRQAGGQDDTVVVPSLSVKPSPAGAEPARLQPRERVAAVGAAAAD